MADVQIKNESHLLVPLTNSPTNTHSAQQQVCSCFELRHNSTIPPSRMSQQVKNMYCAMSNSYSAASATATCVQESCHHGRRRPLRRRHLALATAVAISSVATPCSAFSSTLPCHVTQQFADVSQSCRQERANPMRSSLPVLNMVSFLDAPTTLSTRKDRRDSSRIKAPKNVRRSSIREGKPPSIDSRTVEIEIPDLDDLDIDNLDNFVTSAPTKRRGIKSTSLSKAKTNGKAQHDASSSSASEVVAPRLPPDIDSEILYEGIKSAPQQLPVNVNTTLSQNTKKDAVKPNPSARAITAATKKSSKVAATASQDDRKKKSKSSTMPGFIKDEGLDDHITTRSLKLIASKRKVSRIVRSKKAKLKRRQVNSEAMYRKSATVPDSLLDYAQEIHAVSRVTPKEEIELGTRTQEAMRLQRMYDELQAKYGRDPTDDEWCAAAGKINVEALRDALNDGIEAKNQLVASNLRMVQRVVNLYIRNGLGSEYNAGDLMQDGTMVSSFWFVFQNSLEVVSSQKILISFSPSQTNRH